MRNRHLCRSRQPLAHSNPLHMQVSGRGFSHCMFFLVYKLFLQAGTAYYYYKVLRNLNVNRQSVNIAVWRIDHTIYL